MVWQVTELMSLAGGDCLARVPVLECEACALTLSSGQPEDARLNLLMEKGTAGFKIESIYIAQDAGSPMVRIDSVEVKAGLGLVGDRYASRKGFWQNIPKPASIGRDVSIAKSSDVLNCGFSESETRRNIFVSGDLHLTDLVGKNFYIGDALFFATEECTPCKRPSDLCGRPGFARALVGKGGIRGRALNDATITVGDEFRAARSTDEQDEK